MKKHNYTVIRENGRSEFFPESEYFSILANIAAEHMSAGSNWNRPNMLLMDGKVVVEKGLADLAYKFNRYRNEKQAECEADVAEKFTPEWLKEAE